MEPPAMAAPELAADLIGEIILRLPPTNPTCLVRASLVCKLWRGVISDPTFPRRYAAFHGTPPVLGFFHTISGAPNPRFVPMIVPSAFRQPGPDFRGWRVIDCRHGRVLLDNMRSRLFAVWDPVTGQREELEHAGVPEASYAAAVLCTDDHGHGHGGPFIVVSVYPDYAARRTRARVFSSTTGAWGAPAASADSVEHIRTRHGSVAVGDAIYFILNNGKVLKFDIGKHGLSVIDPPEGSYSPYESTSVLMPMDDGGSLGLVQGIDFRFNSSLHLWSRKVDPDGAAARWVKCRVIEVPKLIPVLNYLARVIGVAEGAGLVFVSNGAGTFTVEVKTGRVTRVIPGKHCFVFPYEGFCTPDCFRGTLPSPVESN